MGLLDKIFGRREEKIETASVPGVAEVECPHAALVPKWDKLEDMGKEELVSNYYCESCRQTFSREEGERLLAEAAKHLQDT